ncbi:MAG: hypothetical protein AAGH92_03920 [Planctomycetota bacterium]
MKFETLETRTLLSGTVPAAGLPTSALQTEQAFVVGRHAFYNRSFFDKNGSAVDENDFAAIAPDKTALLPGFEAGFEHYTSYHFGLNGIFIDIEGLADPSSLSVDDFAFSVGNDSTPEDWDRAPAPYVVTVLTGEGVGNSDRVGIAWSRNRVRGEWLRVEVLANERTGLDVSDVHYWGNAPGESGDSSSHAGVTSADEVGVRRNLHNFLDPALIDDVYDYTRDARVSAADQRIARHNRTNFLDRLDLITPPSDPVWMSPGDPVTATTPFLGTFDNGTAPQALLESGTWALASGQLISQGVPGSAIVTVPIANELPEAYRISATINALPPVNGQGANAGIVFDFRSVDDYKVASVDLDNGVSSITHMVNGEELTQKTGWSPSDPGVDHELSVLVQEGEATLRIDGFKLITARYGGDLHTGRIGIAATASQTRFDDLAVRDAAVTLPYVQTFDSPEITGWTDRWGVWSVENGVYNAAPAVETGDAVVSLLSVQGGLPESVRISAVVTPGQSSAVGSNAMLVFDDRTSRADSFPAPDVPQRGDAGLTPIAGDLEIDDAWVAANGTVLENVEVEGYIQVKADGVTVRNVVADRLSQTVDSTGLVLQDAGFYSTLIGDNVGLVLYDAVVSRVAAVGHNDGAQVYGSNVTITDALLDISQDRPDNHSDAIQVFAPGLALERVSLLARGKTAAINQSGHAVSMTDVSLDGTIFAAAGSSYVNVAAVNPDDVRYLGRPVPEETPWEDLLAGVTTWDVRLKSDFKAAGINAQADTAFVMHVVNGQAVSVDSVPLHGLEPGIAYELALSLDYEEVIFEVDGQEVVLVDYDAPTTGHLGVGAWGSSATFDNVFVELL